MRSVALALPVALLAGACQVPSTASHVASSDGRNDPRLARATRSDRDGWIALHLEGSPAVMGFQYGWLAEPEIEDAISMYRQYSPTATSHDWAFYRDAAQRFFWPKLDGEERAEFDGMI